MKAVRIEKGVPVPCELPKPAGEGVLVKVASASICGTDLHMMEKGWIEGAGDAFATAADRSHRNLIVIDGFQVA